MSKRTYDKYLAKTFNGSQVVRYSISRLVISVGSYVLRCSFTQYMERARRKEQADRAYELQVRSGSLVSYMIQDDLSWCLRCIQGAIKATLYGLTLVTLGHYTWPLFR